jgi:hypothetical protein
LFARDVVGVRVTHLGYTRVVAQHLDDSLGVVAVTVHADGEGLDAAEDEPGVERAGDGTHRVLVERELVGK